MGKLIYLTTTHEQRSEMYDILYQQASDALKRCDPCKFDEKGTCIAMREKAPGLENGCCTGPRCQHLTEKGCGVESLSCRLWLCSHVRMKPKNLGIVAILNTLANVSSRTLPSLGVRDSKQSVLRDKGNHSHISMRT